ncbi:MAG: hypothetical protein HY701_02885 [Gemmatimonadetes bacterium]|nr:hypothetical protein [Gemmatimonadota bacterium]
MRLTNELAWIERRLLEASARHAVEGLTQARARVATRLEALAAERVTLSAEADRNIES